MDESTPREIENLENTGFDAQKMNNPIYIQQKLGEGEYYAQQGIYISFSYFKNLFPNKKKTFKDLNTMARLLIVSLSPYVTPQTHYSLWPYSRNIYLPNYTHCLK